jgi:hypothetical protein
LIQLEIKALDFEKASTNLKIQESTLLTESNDESLTKFRQAIMLHLAGSIVVKEHRERYQKEQFDRFVVTQNQFGLGNKATSLKDFSRNYALFL